jgi:hypothetical protein
VSGLLFSRERDGLLIIVQGVAEKQACGKGLTPAA